MRAGIRHQVPANRVGQMLSHAQGDGGRRIESHSIHCILYIENGALSDTFVLGPGKGWQRPWVDAVVWSDLSGHLSCCSFTSTNLISSRPSDSYLLLSLTTVRLRFFLHIPTAHWQSYEEKQGTKKIKMLDSVQHWKLQSQTTRFCFFCEIDNWLCWSLHTHRELTKNISFQNCIDTLL